LDRVTIADFNGTTTSLPIQKIDTLELWFEENIGLAVRRLCERISGYGGRSEEDGENGRKFFGADSKTAKTSAYCILRKTPVLGRWPHLPR
jgi:hypothetical protein